ncbi:MAG: S-methyl-5'-thioinosine phosphorylase [Pseudomonadota bacterium]
MTAVVIGGTGMYSWPGLANVTTRSVATPFGAPSAEFLCGTWHGVPVAFLARHGIEHQHLPHQVNYRANLFACRELGATAVLALNTVGSLCPDLPPGMLGLPDQVIDYTWGREHTFAGDLEIPAVHAEMTAPYDDALRSQLLACDRHGAIGRAEDCVYGAVQGPRLETAAEVRRLGRDGCHVVGMTGMPETVLARELGLSYACVTITANWAAGYGAAGPIVLEDVLEVVEGALGKAQQLISDWLAAG